MKDKLNWLVEYRPLIVAWIWIFLLIPGLLWWKESVPFLVIMSLYANVESSFATAASKKDSRELAEIMEELKALKERLT